MKIFQPIPISDRTEVLNCLNIHGLCLVNSLIANEKLLSLRNYSRARLGSNLPVRNGFIQSGNSNFLSHTLLAPHSVEIYANEDLIHIADAYCESHAHVSNHRIYENLATLRFIGRPMHWHKDNKIDFLDNNQIHCTKVIESDKGLILIMYLDDVETGGTQFALNSHYYMNNIESFSSKDVSSFEIFTANNLHRGIGILYDYRIIHRAQPVHDIRHRRLSLFSQMSPRNMPKGEPIAINTDVLFALNNRQKSFLNFSDGFSSSPNWPLEKTKNVNLFSRTINKLRTYAGIVKK